MERLQIITWNREISNHTLTNDNLNRFLKKDTPFCDCEKNYQTTDHLLFECEIKCENRNEMIASLKKLGLMKPYVTRDILAECLAIDRLEPMRVIFEFVRKNELKF
jgi:hypothetical protein